MNNNLSTTTTCFGLYRSGDGFQSAEDQINSIEKAAIKLNLELSRVQDLTLGNYKRLDDLVNGIKQMNVDCLIVWRLDCLAPLFKDFESVVKFIVQLSDFNISFISVEDDFDSDEPAAHVLSNLHNAWIELKRNRKIENARRSSLKSQASGNKTGPNRRRDDKKILQLHNEGLSIRKIAKETNFSPALIHQVLKKIIQKTTAPSKMVTDLSPEIV